MQKELTNCDPFLGRVMTCDGKLDTTLEGKTDAEITLKEGLRRPNGTHKEDFR